MLMFAELSVKRLQVLLRNTYDILYVTDLKVHQNDDHESKK